MITRKAISTISYNSDSFLNAKLHDLIRQRYIDFYVYITHLPEDDELKEHKHLYIEPAKTIDTFWLQEQLREPDLANPDMPPLGIIKCVPSKFADWYMYALHDVDYLASKMETRKYHYETEELISSDVDTLREFIHTSDMSIWLKFRKFRDMVFAGVTFRELVKNGFVPIQQIKQYEYAYNIFTNRVVPNSTFRAGGTKHE